MSVFRILLPVLLFAGPVVAEDKKPAATPITFDGQIKSLLNKRCAKCHNGERPRGDLDLSTFSALMQGGTSGKVVVAGKPDASPLYTMTAHLEEPKMPPGAPKIPQSEIDLLSKWIEGGLIEKASTASIPTPEPKASTSTAPAGLTAVSPLTRRTPITGLAVSPTSPLLAIAGPKQVLLYDRAAAKWLGSVVFAEGEIHALKFSADGKVLLAAGGIGGQSGAVVGYDTATWKRLFTITDDGESILAADISSDKTRVAFGGPNRVVKVASVPDGKVLHTLRKATDWVLSVALSPDGLLVAAGDRFGVVHLWETGSGKEFATLKGHTKAATALVFRTDADTLLTASEDHTVRIWDLHTAAETAKIDAHDDGVLDLSWHKSGKIATAGRDGHIRLWDTKGQRVADLGIATDTVLKVAFAPDAQNVFAGDWSGNIRAWPVGKGSAQDIALPLAAKPAETAMIAIPTPKLVSASAPGPVVSVTPQPVAQSVASALDLERKRVALKAVEDAVEKLKDEAARNPNNPALAKAYLQLCEAALAMKAEVIAAEAGKR